MKCALQVPQRCVACDFPLTLKCPNACNWCSYSASREDSANELDLDNDDVDKALEQIVWAIDRGVAINEIRILGGEPTCHSRFKDVLKYIVDRFASDAPSVHLAMMSTNVASQDAVEYAKLLGIELRIADVRDKNKLHVPFPLDWSRCGATRKDVCDPSDWPQCGAVAFRKIDNKGLVWACCPNLISMIWLAGKLDEYRDKMTSMETALDFENRRFFMEKYCRYCWLRYDIPRNVVDVVRQKGLLSSVDLYKAGANGAEPWK